MRSFLLLIILFSFSSQASDLHIAVDQIEKRVSSELDKNSMDYRIISYKYSGFDKEALMSYLTNEGYEFKIIKDRIQLDITNKILMKQWDIEKRMKTINWIFSFVVVGLFSLLFWFVKIRKFKV